MGLRQFRSDEEKADGQKRQHPHRTQEDTEKRKQRHPGFHSPMPHQSPEAFSFSCSLLSVFSETGSGFSSFSSSVVEGVSSLREVSSPDSASSGFSSVDSDLTETFSDASSSKPTSSFASALF